MEAASLRKHAHSLCKLTATVWEVERRGFEADRSAMTVGSVVVLFARYIALIGSIANDSGSKANASELCVV